METFVRELDLFNRYLKSKDLKFTEQRSALVAVFLEHGGHMSAEVLHQKTRKRHEGIGFATVYRTLKHLVDCGLAREVDMGDGRIQYEPEFNHEHHDHLICKQCGTCVEFFNPQIEDLQEKVMKENGFKPGPHRMILYGFCPKCQKNPKSQNREKS